MGDYVTFREMEEYGDRLRKELMAQIEKVEANQLETERVLREEFTSAVRHESALTNAHLVDQDKQLDKIDDKFTWTIGVLVTLLVTIIGALVYVTWPSIPGVH